MLFKAIENNSVPEIEEATKQGVDVNTKTRFGVSALEFAVAVRSLEAARLLVEKGADVNCKDIMGYTILMAVAKENLFELATF